MVGLTQVKQSWRWQLLLASYTKSMKSIEDSINRCLSQFLSSTSTFLPQLQLMSRVRIVDNSEAGHRAEMTGKPAKIIHVYNKSTIGRVGDKVLVAVGGKKIRGYIVGCKQKAKPMQPRFDTNNIILIEDNGMPTGTRIRVPLPSLLRGKKGDFTKILSIAGKFV